MEPAGGAAVLHVHGGFESDRNIAGKPVDGSSSQLLTGEFGRNIQSAVEGSTGPGDFEPTRSARVNAALREAIFEVSSKRLLLDRIQSDQAYNSGLIKTVRAMLRKAQAEHQSAREACSPSELFSVLRLQANLAQDDILELKKRVESLGRWVRKRHQAPSSKAALPVSITCLGTPLVNPRV